MNEELDNFISKNKLKLTITQLKNAYQDESLLKYPGIGKAKYKKAGEIINNDKGDPRSLCLNLINS